VSADLSRGDGSATTFTPITTTLVPSPPLRPADHVLSHHQYPKMAGFGRSNSLSINTGGGGGGGLFGGALGAPASQPSSTPSLFGGANAASNTQQSAAPTTSLFGAAQPAQQQQQQQQTPSLFGSAQPAQQQQQPSLFGSAQPAQQQQQQTNSLFGAKPAQPQQQQQQQTNSLFGSTTQQAQPQQSLFGGMGSQNRPPTLGASTLGGAAAQPVQTTLESMRGTTRFNELHPDLQNMIQQFDEGIQRKIGYCNQIRETLPNSEAEVATIAPDVAYVESFLATVEVGLDNDSANIARLRDLVKKDAEDATLSFRAIENQRLPAQFHYRNSANLTASSAKAPPSNGLDEDDPTKPVDLMSYFNRRTGELDRTLDVYQRQIREIEGHLRTMEAGTLEKAQQLTGSRSAPRDQRRELVEALKAIEGAILDSAKKVGQVRDEVTKQTMGNVGATLL
jgi:nucleoporin p58/p45